jgi:4-hydroxy-3-polyprenylbenzoate decarboxylase
MTETKTGRESTSNDEKVSRRTFMSSGAAGVAALAACGYTADTKAAFVPVAASAASLKDAPRAPFDSFRDWIAALEAHGLLLRFDRIDQDAYEIPGLFFRAADRFSVYGAPCMLFENVKIDGKWVKGPVIVNTQGHWNTDALIWGLEVVQDDHYATYRNAMDHMQAMLEKNGGRYPEIPPVEIGREKAPVKEIVLTGDDIDITKFAFVKTNPADGGRYVNTGSVFMDDPELGAARSKVRANSA